MIKYFSFLFLQVNRHKSFQSGIERFHQADRRFHGRKAPTLHVQCCGFLVVVLFVIFHYNFYKFRSQLLKFLMTFMKPRIKHTFLKGKPLSLGKSCFRQTITIFDLFLFFVCTKIKHKLQE